MTQPIRVLLADDHRHAREGMREIVSADPGFLVVGEASSGEEALALTGQLVPELVLMDIHMPGMGGFEAVKAIKSAYPLVKIVMVTVSDDAAHLFEALKKGAQGYLLKNLNPSAWRDYLHAVALDEAPLNSDLAMSILREFGARRDRASAEAARAPGHIARDVREQWTGNAQGRGSRAGQGSGASEPWTRGRSSSAGADRAAMANDAAGAGDDLTPREREILLAVARGQKNREVAESLGLSEHTVKNHLKNILQKLHLGNRVQLTKYAYEHGMVETEG